LVPPAWSAERIDTRPLAAGHVSPKMTTAGVR